MYRLFACALLLNLVAGHFWHHDHNHGCGGHDHGHGRWGHHWGRHHQEVSDYDRLSQCLGAVDQIMKTSCAQSPYSRTKEFVGTEFYSLKYSLQEFPQDSISVKVKNRAVYVTATQPGIPDFKDLRVLPHFVDVSRANWFVEDSLLTVLFPYKNQHQDGRRIGLRRRRQHRNRGAQADCFVE
ncbi:unnamed protein product, partial [Iphiclides podalirius]